MKGALQMTINPARTVRHAGMSLLEVLIGILVFASESWHWHNSRAAWRDQPAMRNTRTVAINIAEVCY